MMKIKYIALCMLLALIGCQREEDISVATLNYSDEQIEALYYSAEVACVLSCEAPFKEAYVHFATQSDFADYQSRVMSKGAKGKYSVVLNDLEPDTTYYVRYEVSNRISTLCTKEYSEFRTMELSVPVLNTVYDSVVTYNSAVVGGKIVLDGGLHITECGVVYSTNPNPTIEEATKLQHTQALDSFACELTELEVVTTYYARAYAVNERGVSYGEEVEFTTLSTTATLGEVSATAIASDSAMLHGAVLSDGGGVLTACGFCYNTAGEPTLEDSVVSSSSNAVDSFHCAIKQLYRATNYYVRAYATNANGTVYSEPIMITTLSTIAEVVTTEAADITAYFAVVGGKIIDDGGEAVTDCGVCYSTKENPTVEDTKVAGDGVETFSCMIEDLHPGTTYYARTYAVNKQGIAYGNEISFTTLCVLPEVATTMPTEVGLTNATVGGKVTADGGAKVTERGVCYAITEHLTIENAKKESCGTGLGDFSATLTDLQRGTTYYVCAYAINSEGVAYGDVKTFVTSSAQATVVTATPTEVGLTEATVGGEVTDDGGATVIDRGVYYSSTNQTPTEEDNKVSQGEGVGVFTCKLTDLALGTAYYVRAYATNSNGTQFGETKSFTTGSTPATLTTTVASDVTINSATVGGNITSDGGAEITARGVCYSTKENPTVEDTKVSSGSGVGEFICELTNLQPNTTYYVRAYAVNSAGAAYGEEVTFTTLVPIVLPTLTTSAVTQITETSAVAGGNVTSDGNASVTDRGVVYSTNQNPTTADTKVSGGSGTGSFTCNLTDLQPNTTYYVRAYAVNSAGVAYGEEVTFTTLVPIVLPTLTTSTITQITETSAVTGGNVTSDGNASVTERGVCIATVSNPTTSNTKITSGSGTGSFTCNLTNLQPNTTYYVRAYAVNSVGTAYGEEVSFTTRESVNITHYVDLGLPSGLMWATINIGANSSDEYGDYFAWGEVAPKDMYSWATYKYCDGDKYTLTKYNNSYDYGVIDNKYVLDTQDDAAYMNWGSKWRMPTKEEVEELQENCTVSYKKGVCEFTSKLNGNKVSFPYGGIYDETGYQNNSIASFWLNSMTTDKPCKPNAFHINPGSYGIGSYGERYQGCCVRAVSEDPAVEVTLPIVITNDIIPQSENSLEVGGFVQNGGGTIVTERGVVYGTSKNPTIGDNKLMSGNGVGSFTCNLTDLQPNTTYYIRAYAVNSKGTAYGTQVSFSTQGSTIPSSGTENGYGYVDLGLSVKWAICNVGASAPEYYGDYFAWGEIDPKEVYDWSTYQYCNGSSSTLTKYNTQSGYGTVDEKTQLDLADDAARANWGGSWRMPTYDELRELWDECDWTWTTRNGVNGYKVTSKSNGNFIFLPAAGYRNGSSLSNASSNSNLWSSGIYTRIPYNAQGLLIVSGYTNVSYTSRCYGLPVRPVVGSGTEIETTLPSVITSAVTQITETTAMAGGNVTNDGNASVTDRGVVYSTNPNPTTSNTKITSGSGTGSFTCNLTNLQPNTTYYVRAYAVNSVGTAYGEEVNFTTNSPTENGYEYVDLGLPSGLMWATMNVGAETPEDYGDEFAWGEIAPKDIYDWTTYKWCEGTDSTLTKYNFNNEFGVVDDKLILDSEDDAATMNWGGAWRTPTYEEWEELINNTICSWTLQNDMWGFKFKKPKEEVSIFIPVKDVFSERNGYYWSSSLYVRTSYPTGAWFTYFSEGNMPNRPYTNGYYFNRTRNMAVRPVLGPCVLASKPQLVLLEFTKDTETSAVAKAKVVLTDCSERGFVYANEYAPESIDTDNKIVCGSGKGEFTCTLTDLKYSLGDDVSIRAYAINSAGITFSQEFTLWNYTIP